MWQLCWVAIFSVVVPSIWSADTTLRFVTVLWRHGDRAPAGATFPTDTGNGESTWPQGYGELTTIGVQQHMLFGQFLRKRYVDDKGFLSKDYNSKEIYVRSTNYNRTLMSALSNLAGMYPSPPDTDFGNTTWQPIPVHTQPLETDYLLWTDAPCPQANKLYDEVRKSEPFQKIQNDNKDFLDYLKIKSGKSRMDLDDVGGIYDPLNCERIHNSSHTWPEWVTQEIFEKISDLHNESWRFSFHDPRIQKLRGGPLFNDIGIRMMQKAYRPNELRPANLKYYVYSAHDTTVASLVDNLGAYIDENGNAPEYTSAVIFELHEKQPGKFTVETYYDNESWHTSEPSRIVVKGCDDAVGGCTLDTFANVAESHAAENWQEECQIAQPTTSPPSSPPPVSNQTTSDCESVRKITTIASIALGVTTGILAFAFLILLVKYCKKSKVEPLN